MVTAKEDIRNSGINNFFRALIWLIQRCGKPTGKRYIETLREIIEQRSYTTMSAIKKMLGKLFGYVLLVGIFFGLFTVVAVPIEMFKMAAAETWPSRKGLITKSYALRHSSTRQAPWWSAEICGTYQDNGEKFCVRRIRYGSFRFGSAQSTFSQSVM